MESGTPSLFQQVADRASGLRHAFGPFGSLITGRARASDVALLAVAVAAGLLAIQRTNRSWPWAVLSALTVLVVAYDGSDHRRHAVWLAGRSAEPTRGSPVDALFRFAAEHTVGESPNDGKMVLDPQSFSVRKLAGRQTWVRDDPKLIAALYELRPFARHESFRVREILWLLGEFYRRYDRLLNRPQTQNVRHEYTCLFDLQLRILNLVHELYFTQPAPLCAGLAVLLRALQARLFRMLRVLRNRYRCELHGVASEMGSAPRPADPTWTAHDLFV